VTILGGTRPVAIAGALAFVILVASSGPGRADTSPGWEAYAAKDYESAARLWQEEAGQGDPNAAFGLGILADRDGNPKAAATWYEKAARGGLASAQVLLGQRYAEGNGVERSVVTAYAWYSQAIAAGVPNADKLRDNLATEMTPDQVKEAEALAGTLLPP